MARAIFSGMLIVSLSMRDTGAVRKSLAELAAELAGCGKPGATASQSSAGAAAGSKNLPIVSTAREPARSAAGAACPNSHAPTTYSGPGDHTEISDSTLARPKRPHRAK